MPTKIAKVIPLAAVLVLVVAAPAAADSNGKFSVKKAGYSKASGRYSINERFGDTRVWFKGSITKTRSGGCDYLQVNQNGHWSKIKGKCGSKGTRKMYKYVTMGVLDSSLDIRMCHKFDDYVRCGKKQHIKW
ncbi:hypothetical protein ACWFRJ_21380 [Streptomyces sp. NPDC055239]